MHRCRHPDHPHCTVWVMPGDSVCAHGHLQPAELPALVLSAPVLSAPVLPAPVAQALGDAPARGTGAILPGPSLQRPHLHVSGFDPRAAGGRQVLKLELRGMPPDCAPRLTLLASSRLRLDGGGRHDFTRTARGEWLPVFLEFSSRGLEHGQYRIELALHSRPEAGAGSARSWIATLLILAPRPDATLRDIHQTFLATHKNVRVNADDASIARVRAGFRDMGGGSLDIDVNASNAGIAHLDLDAAGGKIDLGFSSIAWDEDLLEVDRPAQAARHPCPAGTACLVSGADAGTRAPPHLPTHFSRYLRLFALDECVLGRGGADNRDADLLLAHHDGSGPCLDGLTRRISARHALIRRGRAGFEIEDVSRYGLLVDGAWPGKHAPVLLRTGMRIELTASIPGVLMLDVAAVLPHGVVLRRMDAGRMHEAFCLLEPECSPGLDARMPVAGLPLPFHRDGGFWLADPGGGEAVPLTPTSASERRASWLQGMRFTAEAYPEKSAEKYAGKRAEKRAEERGSAQAPAAPRVARPVERSRARLTGAA
jgi:hypothetical protein